LERDTRSIDRSMALKASTTTPGNVLLSRHQQILTVAASVFDTAERGYVVFVLLYLSGAVLPFLDATGAIPNAEQDLIRQGIGATIYLAVALFVLARPGLFLRGVWLQKLSLGLILIALASTTWSILPGETLAVSRALAGVSLFGVFLACRFSTDELVRLIGVALAVAAVLSVAAILAAPAYAGDPEGGARGVYVHKNMLGMYMALSTITLALIGKDAARHRWIPFAGAGLSLVLLVLSRSGTGLVVLTGVTMLLPLYHATRFQRGLRIPIIMFGVLGAAVAVLVLVFAQESVVGILGKDTTLTGRTDLWRVLLLLAQERPWLGSGYAGFWGVTATLGGSEVTYPGSLEAAVGWLPHGAHNGFLELWLDLGLLGVVTFVAAYVAAAAVGFSHARRTRNALGLWPISFLSFLLLYNMTEGVLLRMSTEWLLFVAVPGSLRLSQWGERRQLARLNRAGRLPMTRVPGPVSIRVGAANRER
jgi:exopolysaccharide production protein ExoQ